LLVSDDVLNDGVVHKSGDINDVGYGFRKDGILGHPRTDGLIKRQTKGDSGSYSRYFSLDAWDKKQPKQRTRTRGTGDKYSPRSDKPFSAIDNYPDTGKPITQITFPFIITPKASKSERNAGLENREPIKVNDGRQTPIDNPFQRGETLRTNTHPTVKPLKLFSYLITMGSREGDIVLDPFCGSGTTCIAAEQLHRKWIGIDINPQYIEIAKARLKPYLVQTKLG